MAAAAAGNVFTVADAMADCTINDLDGPPSSAEQVALSIFADAFETCRDMTDDALNTDIKALAELANAPIVLTPIQKRNVRAFVQWVKDRYRMDLEPFDTRFPVASALTLIQRATTHELFVKKAEIMVKSAKPAMFSSDMLWSDWYLTLLNFLRSIPRRDGVPLKYICREENAPNRTPQASFLDEYVLQAPMTGEAFTTDAAEVHTYITSYILGNSTAESKIQPYKQLCDGRVDFFALKDHYEGVGALAIDITKAEHTLKSLFYSGEKKPHMWWEEFEKRLSSAFVAYDKHKGRIVHSNEMKLRILMGKVNADFLSQVRGSITVELNRSPMTITYEEALSSFRSEVARKFPPQMNTVQRVRRSIQTTNTSNNGGRGRGGRIQGRGGRGRGGRGHGRGRGSNVRMTCTDSTIITLTDGEQIKYHPSFNFPPNIYRRVRAQDVERLKKERAEYRNKRAQQRSVQSVYSAFPPGYVPPPPPYPNPHQATIATTQSHPVQHTVTRAMCPTQTCQPAYHCPKLIRTKVKFPTCPVLDTTL